MEAKRCAAVRDDNRRYVRWTTTSNLALRANQGGDGAISLREAILAANATRNVNALWMRSTLLSQAVV